MKVVDRAVAGDLTWLRVRGAVHSDAEWPTDWKAEWVCGRSEPRRRAAFVDYAVAGLRATLLDDLASRGVLRRAASDARVEVLSRPARRQ